MIRFNQIYSKVELVTIMLGVNENFLQAVMGSESFPKFFIIDEIEDYELYSVNIKGDSNLAKTLLRKQILNSEIIIKNLINKDGVINKTYLDHLEKCRYLRNNSDCFRKKNL